MKPESHLVWLCSFAVALLLSPPVRAEWKAETGDQWRPMDMSDLAVRPGTALDFSFLVEPGEAGQHGFARINDRGEFVFEQRPERALRFYCASEVEALTAPSQIDAEAIAEQLRLAGYNVVRAHFLDQLLMWKSQQDLVFNPDMVDRWDRFTAALKKRGIYLCIDASTSWAAYTIFNSWDPRSYAVRLKSRLYYDETARAHWREGVRRLLEHVNPYTGLALKDEPQMIAIALRNESGLNFLLQGVKTLDPKIVMPFRAWLKKHYQTTERLRAVWGDALPAGRTIDSVEMPSRTGRGPGTRDMERFFTELERETYAWGAKTLRDLGVKVPIVDYNIEGSIQSTVVRDILPFVDNHAYHDHPSGPWLKAGMKENCDSSLTSRLGAVRWIAATRHWGRPLFCTEWGNIFWNSWRHEGGLTFPAYAAFQNWQLLCQHATPVPPDPDDSTRNAITPYKISRDPAAKANERMAALLFARGDVAPSPHKLEVRLDAATAFDELPTQEALPFNITASSLLTGLGVRVLHGPDSAPRATYTPDLVLTPDGGVEVTTVGEGAQQAMERGGARDDLAPLVARLREKKIFDVQNRTSVAKGIYETDTRELLLDSQNQRFSLNTPRSLGVCLPDGPVTATVGDLQVENRGAGMTLLLSSLTRAPVSQSSHLLLILSGDALNSGMAFKDDTRRELVDFGQPPVLTRVLQVHIRLRHPAPQGWKAWALAQNGLRQEELPVEVKNGGLELTLHTGKLQKGPTPYFELEQP